MKLKCKQWLFLTGLCFVLTICSCGIVEQPEATPTAENSSSIQPTIMGTSPTGLPERVVPDNSVFDLLALAPITPENVAQLSPITTVGEGGVMTDLAVSSDGKHLAIATHGGVILVDAAGGKRKDFIPAAGSVESLAVSPDGTQIAEIHRVPTGKMIQNVYSGRTVVEEPVLTIYQVAGQGVVFSKPFTQITCADSLAWGVNFSPDGQLIVLRGISGIYTNDQGTPSSFDICVISAVDGNLVQRMQVGSDVSNRTAALFLPDGRHVMAVVRNDQGETSQVRMYDIASGQVSQSFDSQGGSITGMTLSPDGQWLALAEQGGVQVIALGGGPGTWVSAPGPPYINLAFSPDGMTLVLGTQDGRVSLWQRPNRTQVWENASLKLMNLEFGEQESTISDLDFSPDGKTIYSLTTSPVLKTSNLVQAVQAVDGHEIYRVYGRNSMVRAQLSPDASWLVFGGYQDGQVQLWSVGENRMARELLGHTGMVMDAVFSPDGSQVATASQDGTVRLWNTNDGSERITLSGHQGAVWSLAYSLDGAYMASVGQDATLRIWDLAAGSLMKTLPTQTGEWRPNTIAFSADGKALFLAYGCVAMLECPARGAGDLRRIDLESGQIDTLLGSPVFRFTLSADRLKIGIMGRQGQQFGDLQSSQFKNIPPSPEEGNKLGGGGLSPDGNLLFAGNYAGLNVWKTDTGETIFTMPGLAISGDMSVVSMQRLLQIDDSGALVHLWGIRKGQ